MDGFRFDFTKGFTNTAGDGSGYDLSRINILRHMASQIWEIKEESYVILEHFAANAEEFALSEDGSDFSQISYLEGFWTRPLRVYPNPVQGMLYLEPVPEVSRLNIFNSAGQGMGSLNT